MNNSKTINWLQTWLIDWFDAMLIRVCQFSLLLGFVGGTVAMLSTQINLPSLMWFNVAWAIVQAISIDGLFFAVWGEWARGRVRGWTRVWYFTVGCFLGCVAALVNDVISYAELNHIPSVYQTMQVLHIPEGLFSLFRSILVVLTAILLVTLPREKISQPSSQGPREAEPITIDEKSQGPRVENTSQTVGVVANHEESMNGCLWDQQNLEPSDESMLPLVARVREMVAHNPQIGYRELAIKLNANHRTVRKYLTQARKDLLGVEMVVDSDDTDDHQNHHQDVPKSFHEEISFL